MNAPAGSLVKCPAFTSDLTPIVAGRHRPLLITAALVAGLFVAQPAFAQKKPKAPQTTEEREAYCASLSESKRRQTEICKTEEERLADARQKHLDELAEKEKPTHTSFLRKFHLDGLWIPTSLGLGQYGLIGTHLDVASVGRVHFFGPPGMLMMLEHSEDGKWHIKPSLTWGVSVYMADVRLPGATHSAQLYFNLTKSWSAGTFETGRDMAGLSLAWKK
jgi:hypothetical protein